MIWTPHATVAVICEKDGKYLLVEEVSEGKHVINQPAGHIEDNELITQAAVRETLEETGWSVDLTGFVGLFTYQSPLNNVTYYRYCFSATPNKQETQQLDKDILRALWLTREELEESKYTLRSPLVKTCIDTYINQQVFPLDIINEQYRFPA